MAVIDELLRNVAYWLTLTLGVMALVGVIIRALIGIVRLWALCFEWYLASRKLKEVYRAFMVEYVRKNGGIKRKARE